MKYPERPESPTAKQATNLYNSFRYEDEFKPSFERDIKPSPTGEMNWLWICQADIIPGYFATPWKNLFSEAVCIGAISVILKGLDSYTCSTTRQYVKTQQRCWDWIRAGRRTYPSYAINAEGGVIISGVFPLVKFSAFTQGLPRIELLGSYEHQVNPNYSPDDQSVRDRIAELMELDFWLSFCGPLPEIYDGPSNLLRTFPALAQRVMMDFDYEFANLDRMFNEGGSQTIQEIAESLRLSLIDQNLSKSEKLFATVGLLRGVKTALCVVHGLDTEKIRDVFRDESQVLLI